MRQAVARLTAKEAARVTITVGVAAYPQDAVDKNDLIAAADIALYLGKQSGEDRVVRADEVPNEMRDLRSTLDRLARAACSTPDDAPTVDSLVEQATLLSHATEHGQDTVRDALLGVARSLDALDPAAIGQGERVGRLAGLVARKLGCDEGAADTVELAARLQGLEGVGADELEPIPSLREVGEIVRWHRGRRTAGASATGRPGAGGGERVRPAGAVSRWAAADRRAAIDELAAAAGQRYGPDVVRALAAVVGVRQRTTQAAQQRRRARGPRSGLTPGRDAMIAPPYVEPPPRRRAPGSNSAWPSRRSRWWWHCRPAETTPSPSASGLANASPSNAVASPSALPSQAPPTPQPTPTYTNPPDPELAGLIPTRLRGATVEVPPTSEFAMTPGDFAAAYGDLGLQFRALQVAYVTDPRLSLYVARVEEPLPTTRQLEPYLETAGRYVGIAGLQREPWRYRRIDGRVTWERPEDNATAAGTHIYTWAADDYVFLLIGVDDQAEPRHARRAARRAAPAQTARPSPTERRGVAGGVRRGGQLLALGAAGTIAACSPSSPTASPRSAACWP